MNTKLMLDQLEARASALTTEIEAEERELMAESSALKAKAERLDAKRERRQKYLFAIQNIQQAEGGDEPLEMMRQESDPWGDAG